MGNLFMRMGTRFILILLCLAPVLRGQAEPRESVINPRYHTYDEIVAYIDSVDAIPAYDNILHVEEIGRSTNEDLPIYAMKFSANPTVDEDQPALLFLGQCHAEEILGVEITMGLADTLLHGFDAFNSHIGSILQSLEVWIVPTYNPEGLRVVHDGWDETYRKNKTDNNNNGSFDFVPGIGYDIDGVDFNRNYDFNWIFGDAFGVGDYDYYRGPAPFSETETQAVAALARRENFLLSVAYHSARSGTPEIIYYSWEWEEEKNPPDIQIMRSLAETLSTRIINESGDGNYAVTPGKTPRGNAHDWFYTQTGAIQFLIEVGTNNLQPNAQIVDGTVARNLEGLFFLMDRAFGRAPESKSQIRGIVTDASTSNILEGAQIQLGKWSANGDLTPLEGLMMKPRVSDEYGRYRRLVSQGTYRVIASAPGYRPDTVQTIFTSDNYATNLDFALQPCPQYTLDLDLVQTQGIDTYQVELWDDFQRDTLLLAPGLSDISWQGDEIFLKISAAGYFPEIHHYDLTPFDPEQNLPLTVNLPANPQVIYATGFDDMSDWVVEGGDWFVDAGRLKSQPDLFYAEGQQSSLSLNGLDLSTVDAQGRLGVFLRHRYEVEWHLDTLALEIREQGSGETILSKIWVDQRFEDHLESVFTYGNIPVTADLSLRMTTDSTVGFRGWELDSLAIVAVNDPVLSLDLEPQEHPGQAAGQAEMIQAHISPNPFRSTTHVRYTVPHNQNMQIQVFDLLGREVLAIDEKAVAGANQWTWNGQDLRGHRLGTGLYFVRFTGDTQSITTKLLMLEP